MYPGLNIIILVQLAKKVLKKELFHESNIDWTHLLYDIIEETTSTTVIFIIHPNQ